MSDEEKIHTENIEVWSEYYESADRLLYPSTHFIYFLMRYALKNAPMSKGLCIGAGDGPEAFAAARRGIHMTCLDVAPASVEKLKQYISAEGMQKSMSADVGDQLDLGRFEEGSFDLAVSWSVISYLGLKDSERAVKEIYRVLRPGGSFIGLIESTESTGFYQNGAQQVSGRSYRMPQDSNTVKPGVVITFFTREDCMSLLSDFSRVDMAHETIKLPPTAENAVARWIFHCRK